MPPITVEAIIAILGVLLGAGVTALINWRKAPKEIANLDAQAEKTKAEAWVMLIQSYETRLNQVNAKLTELECTVEKREIESQERDKRIDDLQDQLAKKEFIIVQQRERLTALESEVHQLRDELDEWKSGRKRKTGPLQQD